MWKIVTISSWMLLTLPAFPEANTDNQCSSLFLKIQLSKLKDPALKNIITQFEASGGSGRILIGRNPFAPSQKPDFQVYKIDKLPEKASGNASIQWLRLPNSFAFAKELMKQDVPLLLVNYPASTTKGALTLTIHEPLTQDILVADKSIKAKSIILMQPDSSKSQVAHEVQHWKDYEGGDTEKLLQDLKYFFGLKYLNDNEKISIRDGIIELRGYSAQEIDLMEDLKAPQPTIYLGKLYAKKSAKLLYQGQIDEALQIYRENYAISLNQTLNTLKLKNKKDYVRLLEILKRYELPTSGKISFTKIFSDLF